MWLNWKKKNTITISAGPGVTISIDPWKLNKIKATVDTEVADIVDAHFAALTWYNSYLSSVLKERKKMDPFARKIISTNIVNWNLKKIRLRLRSIVENISIKIGFAKSTG